MIGFIVAFLFFNQSEESICDPTRFEFILWNLWYSNWTQSKANLPPFIDVANPIWYLEKSALKTSFITSSALTMISILSLFECITCSSAFYLKERKLIAIVSWNFEVSDFLRSFMISFTLRCLLFWTSYLVFYERLRGIIMIDATEMFLAISSIRKNEKK